MKTLRDEQCRSDLIARLERLTPDAKPAWGRMSVDQMLSHLVQSGEMPFESSVPDVSNFLTRTVVKTLALYVMPIPKAVKTAPALDQQQGGRKPQGFENDRGALVESIAKVGTISAESKCLAHAFFGPMSANQWALLMHKHIDHHLRQFGV